MSSGGEIIGSKGKNPYSRRVKGKKTDMKKILVVAAHPDDEILGVGATVAKHAAQGDEVYALILGEGQTSRGEHREDTVQKL